jgi:hypothetical protein
VETWTVTHPSGTAASGPAPADAVVVGVEPDVVASTRSKSDPDDSGHCRTGAGAADVREATTEPSGEIMVLLRAADELRRPGPSGVAPGVT